MRQADDLSDDESFPSPTAASRSMLADDGIRRWPARPPAILFRRTAGRAAPLCHPAAAAGSAGTRHSHGSRTKGSLRYATFADLYRYCYLVASVVGLVCIRIFGYLDPRAEKLAEETGIAFQLTNILRDVRKMRSAAASIYRSKIWSAAV
jgi:phytoene synthase